ncbi:lactonase family protein [Halosimplex aquaticum]
MYVSNRGHQSIAEFGVADDGSLTSLGHTPTGGANPRDFALDPRGRFLLCENRDDFTVVSFAVGDSGGLDERARRAVPKPTCLAFLRRA